MSIDYVAASIDSGLRIRDSRCTTTSQASSSATGLVFTHPEEFRSDTHTKQIEASRPHFCLLLASLPRARSMARARVVLCVYIYTPTLPALC